MFLHANVDMTPISQTKINYGFKNSTPVKKIDIDYNVCYSVFDYEVDNSLPPCLHFLDNFLTSEVYVFSLPLSSNRLSKIPSKSILKDYTSNWIGYPKTSISNNLELGWIGIEKSKIISNIQISGLYLNTLSRKQATDFYRLMLNFCLKEIKARPLYVPSAKTLKAFSKKFSNHRDMKIMESPYTSKILKGASKCKFTESIYANRYINEDEMEFFRYD